MDRISGLPDEVLVKILSFAPTKVAVSTSILSKRWEFLWMWLTKLEFGGKLYSESEFNSLQCFLDRNLPLHRAPVIESFRLVLSDPNLKPEDIKMWVLVVVSRYVRELEIYSSQKKQNILPSSLYTCNSLVILKLNGGILLDVPRMVCLPSLKTLELKDVIFFNDASLQRLLSNCPVLEDLMVALYYHENMEKLTVIVPSLHRLSLYIWYNCEFFIDTPSLGYFMLVDRSNSNSYLIENMPKLMEAYVNVTFADIKSLIGSITSVKRLTISSKVAYGDGFIFNHLEHLTLYVGKEYSSNLLVRFLKDSPNLRELMLHSITDDLENTDMFFWHQPSTVPECMLSSLQNFTWSQYLGRPQDRDMAVYILKNACRLRTAKILANTRLVPKFKMIKELARSSRASSTCELDFEDGSF
ncbi:FBD domain [Arabidopsis suecica]|uniref:FBD domain n=1 Tax=Arabidopsis suecica TaxID=45249 RepID=A0A8T1ZGM7_ARASU|nr:FBD domain [Arabidopsis suecica]